MAEYRKGRHCCGTCAYWRGDREVNASRSVIRTGYADRGECGLATSGFHGIDTKSMDKCSRYREWDVLD